MTPTASLVHESSAWTSSARVRALGSLLGIPVDGLLAGIAAWEEHRRPRQRLSTTLDFDSVALLVRARADRRDDELARLADAPLLVEVTARGAEGRLTVERHALRSAGLTSDLALLRAIAPIPAADHDRFAELAGQLSPGHLSAGISASVAPDGARRWSLHVPVIGPTALRRVIDCAADLGVTAPQRGLVDRLHPILAGRRTAMASLHLGEGAAPELAVTFRELSVESLVRLMAGLRPGLEPASRIGKIADACDADEVASLTLVLGDRARPTVHVAFDLMRS